MAERTIHPPLETARPMASAEVVPIDPSHPVATDAETSHVLPEARPHLEAAKAKAEVKAESASDEEVFEQAAKGDVDSHLRKAAGAEREMKGERAKGSVVDGLEDDALFALMRGFNAQVTHVLSPPTALPAGEPDLRPTTLPTVPFQSELLKVNLERVYATLGVWSIYFGREMMRLMSWTPRDRHRTATFCAAYFTAWWFSLVLPLIFGTLAILTVFPPSRKFLFPPVPPPPGQMPSATDPTNEKGDESMMNHVNHPLEQRSKHEQIEQQAWEFSNTVQRFGMRVIVGGRGKGGQGNGQVGLKESDITSDSDKDDDDDNEDDDLAEMDEAVKAERATKKEQKAEAKKKQKEAKAARNAQVGKAAKAMQDGLGQAADLLECLANALAPPRAYPKYQAREKLAGAIFVPAALAFAVVPAHIWSQTISFAVGVGFFGQPLLIRAAKIFVQRVPDWQAKLDLRNSLLSKVPTNAQLVLHLLRVKEAAYEPLPLPPLAPIATEVKNEVANPSLVADTSEELDSTEHSNLDEPSADADGAEAHAEGTGVAKTAKKGLLGGLKLAAKKAATFKADVTVQGTKAKVGSKIDRIVYQSRAKDDGTPESFPAKLNGKSGHILVTNSPSAPPTISFVPIKPSSSKPLLSQPIEDLVEIKKHGIFVGRAVLGWASGVQLEGAGLGLRFKSHELRKADGFGEGEGAEKHVEDFEGELTTFSHVVRRDQLFARLISIGHQQFETL